MIRVNVPSDQVVYFTLEHTNPRMFRNCQVGRTHVNTYFFRGIRFRGMNSLLTPMGFMGNGLYHTTVNKPHMKLKAGSYTIMAINWRFDKGKRVQEYSLQVYQEGTGTVTVKW